MTIEGWHLWPLFEDLQVKLCESVQKSENPSQTAPGMMHIVRIIMRLWL